MNRKPNRGKTKGRWGLTMGQAQFGGEEAGQAAKGHAWPWRGGGRPAGVQVSWINAVNAAGTSGRPLLDREAEQRRQGLGAGEQGRERGWRGSSGRAGSAADPVGDGRFSPEADGCCLGLHGRHGWVYGSVVGFLKRRER